jgi:hypothetical protein
MMQRLKPLTNSKLLRNPAAYLPRRCGCVAGEKITAYWLIFFARAPTAADYLW